MYQEFTHLLDSSSIPADQASTYIAGKRGGSVVLLLSCQLVYQNSTCVVVRCIVLYFSTIWLFSLVHSL